MIRGETKAFTIVETVLFIAISGLLVVAAMMAVGSRQDYVQFTDSMRSLQSFIETQYSAAQSGVNDVQSGDAASLCATDGGTSGDCVMMGRILTFEPGNSTIYYHTLIGDLKTAVNEVDGDSGIEDSNPRLENVDRTYSIPWGTQFVSGESYESTGGTTVSSTAFGFVRAPRATGVQAMTFEESSGGSDFASTKSAISDPANYADVATSERGSAVEAVYCFQSPDASQKAAILLVGTQVDLEFEYSGC